MLLFSFLWIPLFFLFWQAITQGRGGNAGGFLAFITGLFISIIQLFTDPLIYPGDFGFYRWLSSFLNLFFIPILIPLGICLVLLLFNVFTGDVNITNFSLICLIPISIIKALDYGNQLDPLKLIFLPLLWTSLAVGIPLFIQFIQNESGAKVVFAVLFSTVLPFLAATAYWALFCNKNQMGLILFILTMVPMVLAVILSYIRITGQGG